MSSEKDYEAIKIKGILARCNVVVTERRKSKHTESIRDLHVCITKFLGDFDAKKVAQDLNRLLDGNVSNEALSKLFFLR